MPPISTISSQSSTATRFPGANPDSTGTPAPSVLDSVNSSTEKTPARTEGQLLDMRINAGAHRLGNILTTFAIGLKDKPLETLTKAAKSQLNSIEKNAVAGGKPGFAGVKMAWEGIAKGHNITGNAAGLIGSGTGTLVGFLLGGIAGSLLQPMKSIYKEYTVQSKSELLEKGMNTSEKPFKDTTVFHTEGKSKIKLNNIDHLLSEPVNASKSSSAIANILHNAKNSSGHENTNILDLSKNKNIDSQFIADLMHKSLTLTTFNDKNGLEGMTLNLKGTSVNNENEIKIYLKENLKGASLRLSKGIENRESQNIKVTLKHKNEIINFEMKVDKNFTLSPIHRKPLPLDLSKASNPSAVDTELKSPEISPKPLPDDTKKSVLGLPPHSANFGVPPNTASSESIYSQEGLELLKNENSNNLEEYDYDVNKTVTIVSDTIKNNLNKTTTEEFSTDEIKNLVQNTINDLHTIKYANGEIDFASSRENSSDIHPLAKQIDQILHESLNESALQSQEKPAIYNKIISGIQDKLQAYLNSIEFSDGNDSDSSSDYYSVPSSKVSRSPSPSNADTSDSEEIHTDNIIGKATEKREFNPEAINAGLKWIADGTGFNTKLYN